MTKEVYNSITSRLPLPNQNELEVEKIRHTFPKTDNRDDIVDWILKTKFIDFYTIKIIGNNDPDVDDVIQDLYLNVLEKSQEDWDRLSCQGFAAICSYLSGMIYRDVKSGNSRSYYKYRNYRRRKAPIEAVVYTQDGTPYEEKPFEANIPQENLDEISE